MASNLLTQMLAVAACVSLSGCALFMTPEQRAERRYNFAMKQPVVGLCHEILLSSNVSAEDTKAAKDRGINCLDPSIVALVNAKQQADAIKRAAPTPQTFYTPPKRTVCNFIGDSMVCS